MKGNCTFQDLLFIKRTNREMEKAKDKMDKWMTE